MGFAPEANATGTAIAAPDVYFCRIEKFHGLASVCRIANTQWPRPAERSLYKFQSGINTARLKRGEDHILPF